MQQHRLVKIFLRVFIIIRVQALNKSLSTISGSPFTSSAWLVLPLLSFHTFAFSSNESAVKYPRAVESSSGRCPVHPGRPPPRRPSQRLRRPRSRPWVPRRHPVSPLPEKHARVEDERGGDEHGRHGRGRPRREGANSSPLVSTRPASPRGENSCITNITTRKSSSRNISGTWTI